MVGGKGLVRVVGWEDGGQDWEVGWGWVWHD